MDIVEVARRSGTPASALRYYEARGLIVSRGRKGLRRLFDEDVLERSAQAGARGAGYVALRLPLEIKDLFEEWLATDHPDRAARVMSLVRQMRGGKAYDSEWGSRMTGKGPIAEMMSLRFDAAKKRYGLGLRWQPLPTELFRVPPKAGDQIDLFGC